MKKIGVIVVLLIIGLCACNDSLDYDNKTESTSETINDMNTTVTCSSVSYPVAAETDEMADLLDYKISQFSSDYSFDAVVNVCLDKVGIDDYTLGEEYEGNSEYHPIYYPDYSIVLDELCEGNDSEIVLYQPEEYEYHISRELVIDIWIYVVDFDDDQWAEIGFRRWADEYVFSECDIVVDHCGEGYFFV